MNAFGEFLYELRKGKGMTQAELAERLGVTNKAVSKWETGEAMPETGLLLPLSEIFGVTVDELLNGRRSEEKGGEAVWSNRSETFGGQMFAKGKDDGPETLLDKICGAVCAVFFLGGLAVYLFLGAFAGLWNPYWVIVPVCALTCGMIGVIFHLCDAQKRRRKIEKGKNPYTDAVCGLIILTCMIAYLIVGAFAGLWHPCWVIVAAGIVTDGVVGAIGNCIASRRNAGK